MGCPTSTRSGDTLRITGREGSSSRFAFTGLGSDLNRMLSPAADVITVSFPAGTGGGCALACFALLIFSCARRALTGRPGTPVDWPLICSVTICWRCVFKSSPFISLFSVLTRDATRCSTTLVRRSNLADGEEDGFGEADAAGRAAWRLAFFLRCHSLRSLEACAQRQFVSTSARSISSCVAFLKSRCKRPMIRCSDSSSNSAHDFFSS
mmetsp:Transcript_2023/g.4693  ORF Transcript_2023/g.4693 Transcript_2023/m.4693 type:complete len:209 (-) Transcript_2023:607-1233(-)